MIVLDASALIALIDHEPGGERVLEALADDAVIGAVNLAEVVTKFIDSGWTEAAIREDIEISAVSFIDIDVETAYDAGFLRTATRHLGLSLGDRACLALARRLEASVLTADRAWQQVDVGVPVEVIR